MKQFFILALKLTLGSLAGMNNVASSRGVSGKVLTRVAKEAKFKRAIDIVNLFEFFNL